MTATPEAAGAQEKSRKAQEKYREGRCHPGSFLILARRLKRPPAASLGDHRSLAIETPARSPPAWRLGQRRSRLKFQTGWGRNFIQERRESTSTMRVQSHRKHSRSKVAASVCAILTMQPNFRWSDRRRRAVGFAAGRPFDAGGCKPRRLRQQKLGDIPPMAGNVRNVPALSCDGGPTWLKNSILRHTTGMP